MQAIETKLARISDAVAKAGLTDKQGRHLIHATGGSPKRARVAIKQGVHAQFIGEYEQRLSEASHAEAVKHCAELWGRLMGKQAQAQDPVPDLITEIAAHAEVVAAAPVAVFQMPKRGQRVDLRDLLPKG